MEISSMHAAVILGNLHKAIKKAHCRMHDPIKQYIFAYTNNHEVEAGPGAREVSPQAKRDPLEQHLDEKEHGENHVNDLEDEHQLFVVLEIDVFKAQREARGKNEQ